MKLIEQTIYYKDIYKFIIFNGNKSFKNNIDELINENSIPRLIHRVWVGNNDQPAIVKKCISSISKISNDSYQQKMWNEDNFPIDKYKFAKTAYKKKKWAFVSDVARLHAVYYEGGIYLDTDMEIIKSFDDLLTLNGFCVRESKTLLSFGAFGGKKYNPYIKLLLDFYKHTNYIDAGYYRTANTRILSKIIKIYKKKHNFNKYIKIMPKKLFLENTGHGYVNNYGTGLW